MAFLFFEAYVVRQVCHFAVDPCAYEPFTPHLLEFFPVLSLSVPDNRGKDLYPVALRQGHDGVDDILRILLRYGSAAFIAELPADTRIQYAHVIVNFCYGPHRGAGVSVDRFLIDTNGGRKPFDIVDIGFAELFDELPRIGGEALNVTPLSLGVNGVDCERGFAGTGRACDNGYRLPRDSEVDVFEVVLSGSFYDDNVLHGVSIHYN